MAGVAIQDIAGVDRRGPRTARYRSRLGEREDCQLLPRRSI